MGSGTALIMNELMMEERGSTLILTAPTIADTGTILRCVAVNAAGTATASYLIKVTLKPFKKRFEKKIKIWGEKKKIGEPSAPFFRACGAP